MFPARSSRAGAGGGRQEFLNKATEDRESRNAEKAKAAAAFRIQVSATSTNS